MSESNKSVLYFSVEKNENNATNIDENLNDDTSTREALIQDLTTEDVVTPNIVSCDNDQMRYIAATDHRTGGNVVSAGRTDTQEYNIVEMTPDSMPKRDNACPSSLTTSDRRDHDYSEVRRIVDPVKSSKILEANVKIVKNNSLSLLRATKRGMPVSIKEKSIARVKNISELKKVTPRIKLVSPESTTSLTQLAKINITPNTERKNLSSGENVTREQLKNYCRTCAGLKVPLVDIFSEKGIQMRLGQQMKHLERIKEQDGLSTQMCMDCICDLKMSYKFFMQIKKAQVKLQSISSSLQANNTTTNFRTNSEDEKSRPIATVTLTNSPDRTTFTAKKSESDRSEYSTKLSSPVKNVKEQAITRDISVNESPIKIEPRINESYNLNLSDDNESIEEFDPDDPSFQSDHPDTEVICPTENVKNFDTIENNETRDEKCNTSITNVEKVSPSVVSVKLKKERKSETSKDSNNTVYQYDTNLKAYVKIEPPDDDNGMTTNDNGLNYDNDDDADVIDTTSRLEKQQLNNETEISRNDNVKQPNILKRKITVQKNFLGNPVACVKQSDSTHVRSGPRDMKKPKLNVKNALNVTSENENGIMYVTVKGTKPNELLLVKVKKMEKSLDGKKDERRRKQPSDMMQVEKFLKKLEPVIKKETEFCVERARVLDTREQKIAQQIEEYKRRREKILGGSAGVPNALKFEDGMIRFVNPVEGMKITSGNDTMIKVEPIEEIKDVRKVIESPCVKSETEETRKNDTDIEENNDYDNTGEYLTRLARLKRKWEEAKRKKQALKRELEESYTEGNMEKLARILGEREKNLANFQDYLKQRKIVITRLTDEDVISLYEDRNNATTKTSLPDIIDSSEPSDYIAKENYLECDYCPETFALCDLLEEHLKTHDYKLMYWCEDCQVEFPSVKSKRAHNGDCIMKLTCRYCDFLLDSKGKKRQHEQKHVDSIYGQLCEVCGEKFKHQATLDQHFKTQHMTWEKIYQCTKCPKKFAFKQKLSFHLKSVHTTMRAWLCEDCGADFKNPASLRHHRIRKHHPTGNKRECPVCNKLVPFYSLSKHMYTHKAYTIQCPNCDKMFKNSSTLKQHIRIHEDQRQYRCDTCGVGFNRRDGLRLHMRVHQKSDSRALKECSCQICSEKFPNHSMLVIHRNRVHKDGRQYTCHICNRSMLSTRSLEWHMSHIHNAAIPGGVKLEIDPPKEKKRVLCVHCDKTFKTEMILRTHIKNTHIEKRPTKCPDCEQTFTSDVRLRHHMMTLHNRLEGTLTCPHCPKRFVNQLRLKTHMISHSEDRPYTCEICGFNLKTKIQLIKHHQNRHSDERPLQCRYCPWRCKQVSALVCHERTHTNERPYSCIVCRQRFKYLGDKNKHERRHESLGGSGFKRIVAGRNLKKSKIPTEETSTSELEQIDYENHEEEECLIEEQQYDGQQDEEYANEKFTEDDIVKFETEEIGEEYQQSYEQEYEETSRDASEVAEVIMSMEDTTVYTEEVTADNIETAEIITDEMITGDILQPEITVVHLQQHDDSGKIQVIPVMLSLPDLSDSSAEVNLATASIMYNN